MKSVEGWTGAIAQLVAADDTLGENVQLVAPPADSQLVELMLLEGRWIELGDQNAIALSQLFLEYQPDLKIGDTIRLKVGMEEMD